MQAGLYSFAVMAPENSNVTVDNSPFSLTVTSAAASSEYSRLAVAAPDPVVGAVAEVWLELNDAYNNRVVQPGPGCSVRFSGA